MAKFPPIDSKKLNDYLEAQIEEFDELIELKKFTDGQSNPTFLLTAKSGQYVLRRQPPGELLKSAHAVDREFKVLKALNNTNVPTPKVHHLCEDRNIIGSMFYLMSFEKGRVFWDPAMEELDFDHKAGIYNEMTKTLAAIHNVDLEKAGLTDYGKGTNFFERQISLWTKQYRSAETDIIEPMEQLINWLPTNMPTDDGRICLIHGDYKIDNIMFHSEKLTTLAVLDWELSTLGHPISDLAYYCMYLRLPNIASIRGLGGKNRKEIGVPEEEEIIAQYCELTGIGSIPNWNFYLAFCFFRLASISQGVYKRALSGNASSEHAASAGNGASLLGSMGTALI